eukprot:4175963-Pyramimonas_sp.AAC.1
MLLIFLLSRRGSLEVLEQMGRLAQNSLAQCGLADGHQGVLRVARLEHDLLRLDDDALAVALLLQAMADPTEDFMMYLDHLGVLVHGP